MVVEAYKLKSCLRRTS